MLQVSSFVRAISDRKFKKVSCPDDESYLSDDDDESYLSDDDDESYLSDDDDESYLSDDDDESSDKFSSGYQYCSGLR